MKGPYDDIIHLPHYDSPTHHKMSLTNRAAQFSPFAALNGFEAAINETARITDERIELDEGSLTALDQKIRILTEWLSDYPEVVVTCFQTDENKDGGRYVTITGRVKKIDDYEKSMTMMSGENIKIADIFDISGEILFPS